MNIGYWTARIVTVLSAVLVTACVSVTSGCSSLQMGGGSSPADMTPVAKGTIQGHAFGGLYPVRHATIQLWAVGSGGYGSPAIPLLKTPVTSDDGGFFSITADYDCPSTAATPTYSADTPVFITATGGYPTPSNDNTNSFMALMSAYANCATLQSTSFVYISEVTTIASVYALAQYSSAGAAAHPATNAIGSVSGIAGQNDFGFPGMSGGTLARTPAYQGIANAVSGINNLVNLATGQAGPGPNGNPNAVPETAKMNELASILAICSQSVNLPTGDGSPTVCEQLAAAVTPSGLTPPADTIQMATYMALSPSTNVANIVAMLSAVPAYGAVVSPAITDWTLGVNYKPTGVNATYYVAVDQYGNVWTANYGNSTVDANVAELSPAGALIAGPFTNFNVQGGLNFASATSGQNTARAVNKPTYVAIDTNNNAWFANYGDDLAIGSLTHESTIFAAAASPAASTGSAGISAGYYTGQEPFTIAIDGNNTVFSNLKGASATGATTRILGYLTGGPDLTSYSYGAGSASVQSPLGIAIDSSAGMSGAPLLYVMATGACSQASIISAYNSAGTYIGKEFTPTLFSGSTGGSPFGTNTVTATCYPGTAKTLFPGSGDIDNLIGAAVDHNNVLWAVNHVANSGIGGGAYTLVRAVPNSTFTGFSSSSLVSGGGLSAPYYLAVDGAGNAWVTNSTTTISEFRNDGVALSPSVGFSKTIFTLPKGIAIDGSGNVWVANDSTAGGIEEVIGAAVPVVTPIAMGVKNHTLGITP